MLATLPSYNKIILHTITTKPPVTIVDLNVWNFISVTSARYDSVLFALMRRIVFIWRSMTSKITMMSHRQQTYVRVFVENVLFTDI